MRQRSEGILTLEERAEVTRIQDRLIELYLDRSDALEERDFAQIGALQEEIDGLLREREEISRLATAGAS